MTISRLLIAVSFFWLGLVMMPTFAEAQASPSDYTSATRYDVMGRPVGTIAPDPDGAGSRKYAATRTTYDSRGNAIKVETGELAVWKSELVLPANWGSDFTILTTAETTYDTLNRKLTSKVIGSNNVAISLTQYSYDNRGRLECTATRMNPAAYISLPSSACTLGTEGSDGPDRITKTTYDAASQVLQVRIAVGTDVEAADVTFSYTGNGQIQQVIDANGNRAELRYDGHDRQIKWVFPSKTRPSAFNAATPATAQSTAGSLNEGDFEEYSYDDNGNRLTFRKRDGSVLTYQYDSLNRMTSKIVPSRPGLPNPFTSDVTYTYDLRGLQLSAEHVSNGWDVFTTYDGFGRKASERMVGGQYDYATASEYDKNGNRTLLTHDDGEAFKYSYDGLNRLLELRMGSTNHRFLREFYNNRGLKWASNFYGAGAQPRFYYDPAGRLNKLRFINAGSENVQWEFTRNSASQILSETQDNDTYSWDGHINTIRAYATNGLNQYDSAGGANFCYDANGNLTASIVYNPGGSINVADSALYLYDIENRLVLAQDPTNADCANLDYSGTWRTMLSYDPLGRLVRLTSTANGATDFIYDGDAIIAEVDGGGTLQRRFVHGVNPGADDPLMWFEGSSVSLASARYLYANPRGSIVLVRDGAGTVNQINSYDEYGIPGSNNLGRFQYTGQVWLDEIGMYYYKARIYSPTLGRFLQTDPIGYEDQFNLYAYVGNDPINGIDPTGNSALVNCVLVGKRFRCTYTETDDGSDAVFVKFTWTTSDGSIRTESKKIGSLKNMKSPGDLESAFEAATGMAASFKSIGPGAAKRPLNTDKEAKAEADRNGWDDVGITQKKYGTKVFRDPKTGIYYTRDRPTSNGSTHSGGVWKAARSVEALGSKATRLGTFDRALRKVGG